MGSQVKKLKNVAKNRDMVQKFLKENENSLQNVVPLNVAESIEKDEMEKVNLRRKARNKRKALK